MAAQECEEVFPLDGPQLGRRERFGRNLVQAMGENGVEAQHRAGAGHAYDHLTIVDVSRRQFEVAATDQVKAARILALREKR